MKEAIIALTTALSVILAAGCGQKSGTGEEMTGEERLFRAKCRSCHTLPERASRTMEGWKGVLEKHEDRMELTDEERRALIRHLASNEASP